MFEGVFRKSIERIQVSLKSGKNTRYLNPSNAELNPICHLLVLLGAHLIFHVSGLRVK